MDKPLSGVEIQSTKILQELLKEMRQRRDKLNKAIASLESRVADTTKVSNKE